MLQVAVILAMMATNDPTPFNKIVHQDGGSWRVDYVFTPKEDLKIQPAEMTVNITGWVSNSLVVAHGCPRRSEIVIEGKSASMGASDIIPSPDDLLRCREKGFLFVSDKPVEKVKDEPMPLNEVFVKAGEKLYVTIRLQHDHCIYGEYDPLLGKRELKIQIGSILIKDSIDFTQQYVAYPPNTWGEPPEDHKDNQRFISAPDSLLLDAAVPGCGYFRLPEHKVRYASLMRLEFWYFIDPGTEGEVKARIYQYRELPSAWKVLSNGGSENQLKTVGKWVKYVKIIRLQDEATTFALDFRIANSDVGMVWIDDVKLEPLLAPNRNP